MDIDIKDVIGLSDGNKYVIASKAVLHNDTYYYLIDQNSDNNFKFCTENKERSSLQEIDNEELIQQLFPLFFESATKAITKEDLELLDE